MAKKGKKHTRTLEHMPLLHPHAAGIDVGAEEHWVGVPAERDAQPGQTFSAFPCDLQGSPTGSRPIGFPRSCWHPPGWTGCCCFASSQPAALRALASMPAMSKMSLGARKQSALIVGGSQSCIALDCWRRRCVLLGHLPAPQSPPPSRPSDPEDGQTYSAHAQGAGPKESAPAPRDECCDRRDRSAHAPRDSRWRTRPADLRPGARLSPHIQSGHHDQRARGGLSPCTYLHAQPSPGALCFYPAANCGLRSGNRTCPRHLCVLD